MADYLTRLVERTLGLSPTVRPEIPPTFVPKTDHPLVWGSAGEPGMETDPAGSLPPTSDRTVSRAGDHSRRPEPVPRPDPPEREGSAPLTRQNKANERELPPTTEDRTHKTVELPARTARPLETKDAGEGAATEHHLTSESDEPSRDQEEIRQKPAASGTAPSAQAGREPERPAGPPEPEAYLAEHSGELDVSPPRGEMRTSNARVRAVPREDATGSVRRKRPVREQSQPPISRTAPQEEERDAASESSAGSEQPSEPSPVGGAPLVSADGPRTAPPTGPIAVTNQREATGDASSPTIRVSIGRVEVRAITTEPAQRLPEEKPEPTLSLDDYLRQR